MTQGGALAILREHNKIAGDEATTIRPGLPWREWRDFGNLLRHTCPHIDDEIVLLTIHRDMPTPKIAVQAALGRVQPKAI